MLTPPIAIGPVGLDTAKAATRPLRLRKAKFGRASSSPATASLTHLPRNINTLAARFAGVRQTATCITGQAWVTGVDDRLGLALLDHSRRGHSCCDCPLSVPKRAHSIRPDPCSAAAYTGPIDGRSKA